MPNMLIGETLLTNKLASIYHDIYDTKVRALPDPTFFRNYCKAQYTDYHKKLYIYFTLIHYTIKL